MRTYLDAHALLADALVRELAPLVQREGGLLTPIKGALSQRWFGDVAARYMCDIDLLVPADEGPAHARALQALGYQPTFATPHTSTWVSPQSPISVDCHTEPFAPHLFALTTDELIGRATRDTALFDAAIRRVSPIDAFLLVIGNAGKALQRRPRHAKELGDCLRRLALDPGELAMAISRARMRCCAGWLIRDTEASDPLRRIDAALRLTRSERLHIALLRRASQLPAGRAKLVLSHLVADRPRDQAAALAATARKAATHLRRQHGAPPA